MEVAVYVRKSFFYKGRADLKVNSIKTVWVEQKVKSTTVLIGGFYRSSNSNIDKFWRMKESTHRTYSTPIIDIIITGDFYIDMSQNNDNIINA